jgi:hypothetical protein
VADAAGAGRLLRLTRLAAEAAAAAPHLNEVMQLGQLRQQDRQGLCCLGVASSGGRVWCTVCTASTTAVKASGLTSICTSSAAPHAHALCSIVV